MSDRRVLLPLMRIAAAVGLVIMASAAVVPVSVGQEVQVEMGLINDLELNGQAEMVKKQLEGNLALELGFVRRACDPTPEQKEQILAAAKECLDVVAQADKRAPQRRGGGVFVVRNGRVQERQASGSLRRELKERLRDILEKEQWERYQEEWDKREAFVTEVFIDQVMACYEERLALTAQQQKEVRESLKNGWKPGEQLSLDILRNNPQFLPQLPDNLVLPFLDENQKTIYRAAPKLNLEQQIGAVERIPFRDDSWELPE